MTIALRSSTESGDSSEMVSPAETRRTTGLSPAARPTPSKPELARAEAVRPRPECGCRRRARAARVLHKRSRAAQRAQEERRRASPPRPCRTATRPARGCAADSVPTTQSAVNRTCFFSLRRIPALLMSLVIHANGGFLQLAAEPYDETVVHWIRTVPQRRYSPQTHDWCIPARREHLQRVCSVIAELEERGIAVEISKAAAARLAEWTPDAPCCAQRIEIAGSYSERRLPALRALPERRFDAERKLWTIPLTRAGALAILALADDTDELVMTQRARRALHRSATASPPVKRNARDADAPVEPTRRSPVAHWRHYTAGAVFDNPARPRINVPGIGWCVRIRVNPGRGNGRRARSATTNQL